MGVYTIQSTGIDPQDDGYITLYSWVIMLIRTHTEFLPFPCIGMLIFNQPIRE